MTPKPVRRRSVLRSLAIASISAPLSGCSQLQGAEESSSNDSPTPSPTRSEETPTPTATAKPSPTVEWSESRVKPGKLAVTLDVTLDGASSLDVIEIDTDGDPVRTTLTTLESNGSHRIAGGNTAIGLLDVGTVLHVDITGTTRKIGEHMVGETTTPIPGADQLDGLSGSTLPDPSVEGAHDRMFSYSAHGLSAEFSVAVPKALYQYYKRRPRIPEYGAYSADRFDDSAITNIATTIEDFGDRNNLSARQTVDHAIAWVQSMQYTQDEPTTGYNEYPKYPFETLVDRGGDCEDTCILLGAVLKAMGYDVVLLLLRDANHMALGVAGEDAVQGSYYIHEGTKFYYVDTTGSGWRVGEVPQNVKEQGSNADIREMGNSPSLALDWQSYTVPVEGLKFDVVVSNWGDAPATDASVQVDIRTESGNIVAQDQTSLPELPPKNQTEQTLTVQPPTDRPLRARIGALLDGTVNDLTETDLKKP